MTSRFPDVPESARPIQSRDRKHVYQAADSKTDPERIQRALPPSVHDRI